MVFAMGSPVSGRDCVLPQSSIVPKTFPPSGGFGSWPWAGSPASGWRCVFWACVSPGGYLSYVFLQDVVTLWVNSVFLSLLIANGDLHCWLFLFRYSHPYWGRDVFICPLSVCRNFWWLVATLFPGLSLFFASGLSSPGLLGCLALCLRYADLLYLWLCAHSLLDQGIRGLFACPSPSNLLWFCKFWWVLFSPMVHTLHDGVTPAGSRLLSSIGTKV